MFGRVELCLSGAVAPARLSILCLAASTALVVADLRTVRLPLSPGFNASDSSCTASVFPGESLATARGTNVGCIGGGGGSHFEGHAYDQSLKSFTLWPWGGANDGATGLAWRLTNDQEFNIGEPKKEHCPFTFEPGDYIVGDIGLHGNGDGTRLGRIEFNVRRGATGQIESYGCGHEHTRYNFPADGMVIAGFVGSAGSDIDNLGVIIKKPDCSVDSREITDMECVTPVGGDKLKCSAVWADAGSTDTAHAVCDWCASSNDGVCGAQFTMSETHSASTTSTNIDELGGSVTFGAEVSLEFLGVGGKATDSYSVNYQHTWESSKSQTFTTTSQISSTCSVNMKAHSKTAFDALAHTGHMTADIRLTVTSKDHCGGSTAKEYDGKVTITNVPIIAMISECKPQDVSCASNQTVLVV